MNTHFDVHDFGILDKLFKLFFRYADVTHLNAPLINHQVMMVYKPEIFLQTLLIE